MDMPQPQPFELIPPRKAQTGAQTGASSPSQVLSEEMVFESLMSMQWTEDEPPTETDEDVEGQVEKKKAEEAAKGDSATTAADSAKATTEGNPAAQAPGS